MDNIKRGSQNTYDVAKQTILDAVEETLYEHVNAVREDIDTVAQKASEIETKVDNISAIVQNAQEGFNDKLSRAIETSNTLKDAVKVKQKDIDLIKSDLSAIKSTPKEEYKKPTLKDIEGMPELIKEFQMAQESISASVAQHVSQPLTTTVYSDGNLVKGSVTKLNFLGGIASLSGDTVNIAGGVTYSAIGTLAVNNYVPTWSPTAPTLGVGLTIRFFPDVNNPANATFDGVLIKEASVTGLTNLEADDLIGGGNYELVYNGTFWVLEDTEALGATIVTTVTADPAYTIWNRTILANATGGAFNITLPTAAGFSGQLIEVKKIDSSSNVVTILPSGAETIDGGISLGLSAQNTSYVLRSDGTNVEIVASYKDITPPYVATFNNNTDWGAASGGLYTINIPATTHLLGTNVQNIVTFETVGPDSELVRADRTAAVDATGDVAISVTELPDGRFAGRAVISGSLAGSGITTSGAGVTSLGAIGSLGGSTTEGAVISGTTLALQLATASQPGIMGLSYQNVGASPSFVNSNSGGVKGSGLYNPDTTDNNGISMNWETDTTGAGAQTQYGYQYFGTSVTDHNHATFSNNAYWNNTVNGVTKTIWNADAGTLALTTDYTIGFNNGIQAQASMTVTSGGGFTQGNGIGGSINVPAGAPVTGTSPTVTSLAPQITWSEDIDQGIAPGLGMNAVGYVGQIIGAVTGKTADTINMALAGASDGGSVAGANLTNFNMYNASGLVGGTAATVTNLRGFYVNSIFGGGVATNEYGVSVNAGVDNYFQKSITVGQATESKTTETNTAIEIGGDKDLVLDDASAVYIGAVNTDGTWRYIRSGNDLLFQRREVGVYVTKQTITA